MAAPSPKRQRAARDRLAELFGHPASAFVIHYACQSFSQPQRYGSPRITSIAIRNIETGQTTAFSIHEELELANIPVSDVHAHFDQLEYRMLEKYFVYLRENRNFRFLHWNMRDQKFGFSAIEHRFRKLGGTPFELPEQNRSDLAIITSDIYGSGYLPKPYLQNLAERNGLTTAGFLAGAEEPAAFSNRQFARILQSTLCKVTVLSDAANLIHDGTLKTDATLWTLHGGRVREIWHRYQSDPVAAFISIAVSMGASFFAVLEYLDR